MSWVKEELLGSGSFGQVYRARCDDTGCVVVIKEVPAVLVSNREIALMITLRHPHIIRYLAHNITGDSLQLILEYAECGTLAQHIESSTQPLLEQNIIFITSQMVSGLDYLHRRKIVHRDLKPSNILQVCPSVIKLADFGTSKCIDVSESSSRPVGTLSYMAPEIFNGGSYKTSSDIWSLGCIVYYMAERVKPFRAEVAGPLILSILSHCANPINEPYSKELSQLVSAMMNHDEVQRPSTTDLLVHPLLTCTLHSLPVTVPTLVASWSLNHPLQDFLSKRLVNP